MTRYGKGFKQQTAARVLPPESSPFPHYLIYAYDELFPIYGLCRPVRRYRERQFNAGKRESVMAAAKVTNLDAMFGRHGNKGFDPPVPLIIPHLLKLFPSCTHGTWYRM